MKFENPVYQTPGDGQCFRACVATMLGVPLGVVPPVPKFASGDDPSPFWNGMRAWCRERGYDLIWTRELERRPKAPIIVGCKSPRGVEDGHAVIIDGASGKLLHDPFPGPEDPVEGITEYYLFIPLQPWKKP